jgi:predicted Zn-dependent protease
MIDISGRNHRAAKPRRYGITKYLQTAYVKAELLPQNVEVMTTRVDRMRASDELAEGLTVARALLSADDGLIALPKDKAKASSQVAIAVKSKLLGNGPYVRFKAHEVALANGDVAGAIAHLEVARKHPDASPLVYRELIRLLARSGRLPQAKAALAEGRKRYADKAYFLPSDILVQVRSRQYDEAEASMAACKKTNRDGVILDCKAAALDVNYKETPPAEQEKLKPFGWGPAEAPAKKDIPGLPGRIKPRLPWGG